MQGRQKKLVNEMHGRKISFVIWKKILNQIHDTKKSVKVMLLFQNKNIFLQ